MERWRQFYQMHFSDREAINIGEHLIGNNILESLEVIEEDEVEYAIEKIKTGKAAGWDGIASELMKFGGQELIKVFNKSSKKYGIQKKSQRIGSSALLSRFTKKVAPLNAKTIDQ